CPSMSLAPSGSIRSLQPSQLYLDHSHCPVLAPATLAALPSTRAIETRLLPSFDSCAPAHLKLGRVPASSPLPSRLCLLCRFSQKLHSTSRFAHLCRSRPRGSVRERETSRARIFRPPRGQPPVPLATVSKVQVVIVPSTWGESSTAPHAIAARPTRYCEAESGGCAGNRDSHRSRQYRLR